MKLNELLLTELTGVKKFYHLKLEDMLIEIKTMLNCEIFSGAFGWVLVKDEWDYVYKIWYKDPAYETYVEWMLKNQFNKHVPKIKRKIVKLDSFNLRPDDESFDKLNVLKIEKLSSPEDGFNLVLLKNLYGNFTVVKKIIKTMIVGKQKKVPIKFGAYELDHLRIPSSDRFKNDQDSIMLKDLYKTYPEAEGFFEMLANYYKGHTDDLELDMHSGNVMYRESDKTFVIIDPTYDDAWFGDNSRIQSLGYKEIKGRSKSSGKSSDEKQFSTDDIKKASNAIAF